MLGHIIAPAHTSFYNMFMKKKRIKDIDEAISYLQQIDYYENKTEDTVRNIFKEAIQNFLDKKITISFLAALCTELLYFKDNIGSFTDTRLRNTLLAGEELSHLITFNIENKAKYSYLVDKIMNFRNGKTL